MRYNQDGDTVVILAADNGNMELVQWLAEERGAYLNHTNNVRYTRACSCHTLSPHAAHINGKRTNVILRVGSCAILTHGLNIGLSCLSFLCERSRRQLPHEYSLTNTHVLLPYLSLDLYLHGHAQVGGTCVTRAAARGHFEVVRWLGEHGADVKHADDVCLCDLRVWVCIGVWILSI